MIVEITVVLVVIFAYIVGRLIEKQKWKHTIKEERRDAIKRSRAVLKGKFTEQLAPYLPDFKYSPTEVRFVGKPIDFIVFKGLDSKEPDEIVFVEVKTGESRLSKTEKKLKNLIEAKKISWEIYRPK